MSPKPLYDKVNENMKQDFFEESKEQSQIKTEIVSKYFMAWANVMISNVKNIGGDKLAYIDLFSGPGIYQDGTKSTPVVILEYAINHNDLSNMLVTIFNDKNSDFSESLENTIKTIPRISKLKYKPEIYNETIGGDLISIFEKVNLIPSLVFIDPWGYKGLSGRLIAAFLKDFGCDCIFFFNYNRINMGLSNPLFDENMAELFGQDKAKYLKSILPGLNASERELTIIEELCSVLKEAQGQYVLPFCFKNEKKVKTSHHLIFVTKHPLGYEIMKSIMSKYSSSSEQGVPSFVYSAADNKYPLLFELARPLDDLENMIMSEFAGKSLTMKEIYFEHNVGRPYLKNNYKKVLLKLESEGKIITYPPSDQRRKIKGESTFSDGVIVIFPKKG
ncbi:MAG: three-Cys-motif partner protein TcmP [bacterium]|nr:three-Cys-motif partner protein TcmP [bacterium]